MAEFTAKQAAEKLGCHLSTICRAAKKLGIPKRTRDYLFTARNVKQLASVIHDTSGNPDWIKRKKK